MDVVKSSVVAHGNAVQQPVDVVVTSLAHGSATQQMDAAAAPVAVNRPTFASRPVQRTSAVEQPHQAAALEEYTATGFEYTEPVLASAATRPLLPPPAPTVPTSTHNSSSITSSSTPKRSFRDRLVDYEAGSSIQARLPLSGSTPVVPSRSTPGSGTMNKHNNYDYNTTATNNANNNDDDDDDWGLDSSPPIRRLKKPSRPLSLRSTASKKNKSGGKENHHHDALTADDDNDDITPSANGHMSESLSLDTDSRMVIQIDDDDNNDNHAQDDHDDNTSAANFDFFTIPMDVDMVAVVEDRTPGRNLCDLYNLPRHGHAYVKVS